VAALEHVLGSRSERLTRRRELLIEPTPDRRGEHDLSQLAQPLRSPRKSKGAGRLPLDGGQMGEAYEHKRDAR
jgi:hypothetical protein